MLVIKVVWNFTQSFLQLSRNPPKILGESTTSFSHYSHTDSRQVRFTAFTALRGICHETAISLQLVITHRCASLEILLAWPSGLQHHLHPFHRFRVCNTVLCDRPSNVQPSSTHVKLCVWILMIWSNPLFGAERYANGERRGWISGDTADCD